MSKLLDHLQSNLGEVEIIEWGFYVIRPGYIAVSRAMKDTFEHATIVPKGFVLRFVCTDHLLTYWYEIEQSAQPADCCHVWKTVKRDQVVDGKEYLFTQENRFYDVMRWNG